MKSKTKVNWKMVFFLAFVYLVEPFITGYLAGLNVQKSIYTGPITTSKQIERSLSGSQNQTVFWSLDAGGSVTIELGVTLNNGTTLWSTFPGVGPFPVTPGVPEFQPLFIPVCEKVRMTYTGSATGTLAVIDS